MSTCVKAAISAIVLHCLFSCLFVLQPYVAKDDEVNKIAFDTERVFPPNIVFDAASWGQYYGGTPNKHSPGYTGKKHYVGQVQKYEGYFSLCLWRAAIAEGVFSFLCLWRTGA